MSKSALVFSILEDRSLGEMSPFAPQGCGREDELWCGWECQRGAPLWRQKSQNPSFPSAESRDAAWDGMGSWVCCSTGLVSSSSDFRKGKARNSFSLLFVLLPNSMGSLFPGCLETDDLEQTELGFFLLQL